MASPSRLLLRVNDELADRQPAVAGSVRCAPDPRGYIFSRMVRKGNGAHGYRAIRDDPGGRSAIPDHARQRPLHERMKVRSGS
jgi:hypothetical protein